MTPDIVIVGGGIAGLCTALAAAEKGLAVTVVDAPSPGAASRAAAGMLAPSLEGLPESVLPHALAARDYYPEFLGALHSRTGVKVELNRRGILELADHERDLSALQARAFSGAETISPAELHKLEPALAPHAGAILHPHDGAVDNVQLMAALERAIALEPRISAVLDRVIAINPTNGRLTTAQGSVLMARRIVLAGGAWMSELHGLPRRVPVLPVRGQLLTLANSPLQHVMYAPRTGYLVPRGGALLVGATIEHTGFVNETTSWGRQELLAVVARTLPGLRSLTVVDHWAGLRPMTPDALPILGPDPETPVLLYAGGFSRNGILLAPWAARELAESLESERPVGTLDSFSVGRFGVGNQLNL